MPLAGIIHKKAITSVKKCVIISGTMRARNIFVLGGLILVASAATAASLLQAQQFPKTFNDLSFTQRMAVLADGYTPFESEYDENGHCISGCPYAGITFEEEQAEIDRLTRAAMADLAAAGYTTPVAPAVPTTPAVPTPDAQPVTPAPIATTPPVTAQPQPPAPSPSPSPVTTVPTAGARTCRPVVEKTPVGNRLPTGCPLMADPLIITSPFGYRTHPVHKTRRMHYGIDISATMGTDVFAAADGTVTTVVTNPNANACGIYVKITHDNNYASTYCHLSKALVKQGERVSAGCRIGQVGSTGVSTGPHLHYAITPNAAQGNRVAIDPTTMIQHCGYKYR